MYFYDSNKGALMYSISCSPANTCTVVSGCVYTARDDPGNLQLDWLEVQLKMYRERGIQVTLLNSIQVLSFHS